MAQKTLKLTAWVAGSLAAWLGAGLAESAATGWLRLGWLSGRRGDCLGACWSAVWVVGQMAGKLARWIGSCVAGWVARWLGGLVAG